MSRKRLVILAVTACFAALWLALLADWLWLNQLFATPLWYLHLVVFGASLPLCAAWLLWARWQTPYVRWLVASVAYVPLWHLAVFTTQLLGLETLRAYAARFGLIGLFLMGLGWTIWGVDRAARHYARRARSAAHAPHTAKPRVWNPLDLQAWYYGRKSQKLFQSLAAFSAYALNFVLAMTLFLLIGGCQEIYELPAGGGKPTTLTRTVKIQKVIKKKFVINPFSAIIFNPPPIDEIKLNLLKITQHQYKVGDGEGDGAGFSGGTSRGKVRFIRLEYAGGDWNQDFGVGADLNMLVEYGARTGHKVASRTESRTVAQLKNFPVGKSPPLVYLTGQKSISLSQSEVKILREYLIDKHGMLFGDNGGSGHFHNQFFRMMRQVLPNVEPVRVPLDDPIHSSPPCPYEIPFLPYVAPHGGKDAFGWKMDGRWLCYYHPGDIGDAWTDEHAGVKPEIAEYCYQLGVNVIFYAHLEYNRWLNARRKR